MNARNDAQFSAAVRTLAAEVGFRDPGFRGELATLFDGAGRTRRYLRRNGVTVDDFGELLFDRGLVSVRPTVNDVLALLGTVFDGTSTSTGRRKRRETCEALSVIERQALRAKKNRSRKFACPVCPVKCNAAASTFTGICGRCYDLDGVVRFLVRCEPTFEEVMEQAGQLGGAA